MVPRAPLKLALYLAAAACTVGSARAEDDATPPAPATDSGAAPGDAPRRGGEQTRLKVSTPLDAFFTSNLFHVQGRRLDTFDANRDPGQRFDGIETMWDIVLRPGARAAVAVPLGKKRDVELGMGADYYLHQNNGIANYPRLVAEASCDLTGSDGVAVDARYVPRRFLKNHHPPDDSVGFEHDYATQLDLAATYDREWSGAVATRVEYSFQSNVHEDPFQDRDLAGQEGRASLLFKVARGSRVFAGGGFGVFTARSGYELDALVPVLVDRSFRESVIFGGLRLAASPLVELEGQLELRTRDFTTDVEADTTYFDRVDRRLQVELALTRKLKGGFSLQAFAAFTRNYSNRSDPNLTADEAGYQEIVLGGAATWRFSTGR